MADTMTGQDRNTFDIGLVLAGAVSAGAYSAGVIDFLIEAIDRWYDAKKIEASQGKPPDQWRVPTHDIRIRAISGASAGSMVAALAAVVLNEEARAVTRAPSPEEFDKTNKLYSSWVVKADMASMLTTTDLEDKTKRLTSLLDSSFLVRLAEETIKVEPPGKSRDYVADPLPLFISVTNLRGVPYSIDFKGSQVIEHGMSNHADFLLFDIVKPGTGNHGSLHPGSIVLHPGAQGENTAWKKLAQAAVASGAFPLALAPAIIQRDAGDYNEREWTIPFDKPKPVDGRMVCSAREKIPPAWDSNKPGEYSFLAVDGGVMNNEPMEYARQEIAGAELRNERSGEKARRAVVMIDPFPDSVPFNPDYRADTGLLSVAGAIFSSLMSQAKFKADELKLAHETDVFSRFVIAPTRSKTEEESQKEKYPALASNSLVHFGGFLSKEFRHHDFLLGRRNCQRFLQKYFVLPANNQLFENWPKELDRTPYLQTKPIDGKEIQCLPIIPLVGDLAEKTGAPKPSWPRMKEAEVKKLKKDLDVRTRSVLEKLVSGLIGRGKTLNNATPKWKSILWRVFRFKLGLLAWLPLWCFSKWLTGKMIKKIKENLAATGLLEED